MTEPAAPNAASTVILLRQVPAGPGFEVYLCRRHRKSSFMGGAYVFPGGRLNESDRAPELEPFVEGAAKAREALSDLDPAEAVALHLAAIRELFEEAGVLLARDSSGKPLDVNSAGFADRRQMLQDGRIGLLEMARALDLRYDLEALMYWAHWITPEVEPKRFSARFFLAVAPEGQQPVDDGREVFEGRWYEPRAALEGARGGGIFLAPPTLWNLHDLDEHEGIGSVREEAARRRGRIGPILPRVHTSGSSLHFILPGDPAYDDPEQCCPTPKWRRTVLAGGRFEVYRGK